MKKIRIVLLLDISDKAYDELDRLLFDETVDLNEWTDLAADVLTEEFGFNRNAIEDWDLL